MNGIGKKTAFVVEQVREKIRSGESPVGAKTFSVRALARQYSVSPETAAKAVALLQHEGVLRSEARRGLYVARLPQKQPVIGYAGFLPNPQSDDPIQVDAISRLYDALLQSGCETRVIFHRELHDPKLASLRLQELDCLLLNAGFLDPVIDRQLAGFSQKLVIFGSRYILEQYPCSQVIPELFPALEKFNARFPFRQYRRLVVITLAHNNALAFLRQLLNYFERIGVQELVETVQLGDIKGSYPAELAAYKYFKSCREQDFKDCLVISLSDYCSRGIYEAGQENCWMPEVLSCDNVEGLVPQMIAPEPYFTSIDWKSGECYRTAAELALRSVRENDPKNYVIRIPADVIFRKSVHGK